MHFEKIHRRAQRGEITFHFLVISWEWRRRKVLCWRIGMVRERRLECYTPLKKGFILQSEGCTLKKFATAHSAAKLLSTFLSTFCAMASTLQICFQRLTTRLHAMSAWKKQGQSLHDSWMYPSVDNRDISILVFGLCSDSRMFSGIDPSLICNQLVQTHS